MINQKCKFVILADARGEDLPSAVSALITEDGIAAVHTQGMWSFVGNYAGGHWFIVSVLKSGSFHWHIMDEEAYLVHEKSRSNPNKWDVLVHNQEEVIHG